MTRNLPLLPRGEPLSPRAAAAEGAAAIRLARRLLALPDEALAHLEGVAGRGLLVVLGPEAELPWVDGVRYLGADPDAPGLLVPTPLRFGWPAALVRRALLASAPPRTGPFAVLLDPLRLVSVGGARTLERARLAAWLEAAA